MDQSDVSNEDKVIERMQESVDKRYEMKHGDSAYGEAEKEAERYDLSPEDVPDGARISKAFDKLCNKVKDRIRGYKKPEPSPDFFTKGRYVLVTGDSSYMDPCFCSSTPQAGGMITVTITPDILPGDDIVLPIPELPEPSESSESEEDEASSEGNKEEEEAEDDDNPREKGDEKKDQDPKEPENKKEAKKPPDVTRPDSTRHGSGGSTSNSEKPQRLSRGQNDNNKEERSLRPFQGGDFPSSMSYEKVEVVESIEKISDDRVKSYEETATIVETMIEKTRKK